MISSFNFHDNTNEVALFIVREEKCKSKKLPARQRAIFTNHASTTCKTISNGQAGYSFDVPQHGRKRLACLLICWRPAEIVILTDLAGKKNAGSGLIDMEQIPFDYCCWQQRHILTIIKPGHTVKDMANIHFPSQSLVNARTGVSTCLIKLS
ncbi:hypothetical protein [Collimonas sp. OK307]|uniref:hypothetical protein n=1 Tax=Collimonas sp. OK307 TaxID=1801620 RepID=UPI0015873BC1|nr:hypothetical protein [Collimonas sp. OK307]